MSLPARTAASLSGGPAQHENGPRMELEGAAQGRPAESDKDAGGDSDVVKPSHFDRLPDELVLTIFGFASEQSTLNALSLSKRLYPLARAACTVSLRPSEERQPFVLQQFILRPDLQPCIRTLDMSFSSTLVALPYEFTAIRLFRNLTSLKISGALQHQTAYSTCVLPRSFSAALGGLPSLRELFVRLDAPFKLEDPTFDVQIGIPSLRSLTLRSDGLPQPTFIPQLLETPCRNLEHLELRLSVSDGAACARIPWSTLRSLVVAFDYQQATATWADEMLAAVKNVRVSSENSLPLTYFCLDNDILLRTEKPPHLGVNNRQIPSLFQLIRLIAPRRLGLAICSEIALPAGLQAMPSVEVLTFLNLIGATYGPLFFAEPAPPSPLFFIQRPNLLALLHSLRETAVLQFEWKLPTETATYNWWRTRREEDFQGDLTRPF
ncbi:hypothetical protein JCM6882_000112 [Rhodosporidiobolus microsporus]